MKQAALKMGAPQNVSPRPNYECLSFDTTEGVSFITVEATVI